MEANRLADVRGDFVQGIAFGDHGKIQTLRHIFLLASKNAYLDGPAFHNASLLSFFVRREPTKSHPGCR